MFKPRERAFKQFKSPVLNVLTGIKHVASLQAEICFQRCSFFGGFRTWLHASAAKCRRSALFWDVTQRIVVESGRIVMAHGDAREGKWRGNWRMEWVASTLHTTSEHGVSSFTTAASSRLNWLPRRLNGLVRFTERRNLVSARVPSHLKRSLPPYRRFGTTYRCHLHRSISLGFLDPWRCPETSVRN